MISQVSGTLDSIDENLLSLSPSGMSGAVTLEVLAPAYLAQRLSGRVGQRIVLSTFMYLESQGQGSHMLPRLIGFETRADREFFELFTTVKGIGYRKALRALAEPPSAVAGAIARRDAKALTALPEVGKRLAETILAELDGKVQPFLAAGDQAHLEAGSAVLAPPAPGPEQEAVEALVALGEVRVDAERQVARAVERGTATSVEEILAAVFARKGR
jgi:Holliday junction DNA helicase RuvA